MLKALFYRINLDYVIGFLKLNDIEYQEWSNQDLEVEIRIDLYNISDEQKVKLFQEFYFEESPEKYSYLIFWK